MVGRSHSADIMLVSGMISRNHTRFAFVGDHWMLQDLGATNGTRVNGKQVESCRLDDGDLITIGDAELQFMLVP